MTDEDLRETLEQTAAQLNEFFEDVLILVCEHKEEDGPPRRQVRYTGRGHHWARMGMAMQYVIDHSMNSPKENNYDEI